MGVKEDILGVTNILDDSDKKMFKVLFKKNKEGAVIPSRNTITDAGLDLVGLENVLIAPKSRVIISTGISWEPQNVPTNHIAFMNIHGRSGNALKKGFSVLGGVVDQNYRGEIKVIIQNNSWWFNVVKEGDKIAQGVVYLIPKFNIEEAKSVSETDRADKGFGSSDKK